MSSLRFGLSVAAMFWVSMSALAQVDPLDLSRQELTLKSQKVVREVNLNFAQARAVERYNPQKARDILRLSKAMLEDDVALPERQRQDLLRQVNARLTDLGGQIAAVKKADEIAAQRAEDRVLKDQKKKYDDRSGPVNIAKGQITTANEQLAALDKMRARREKGFNGLLNSIGDYSVPENGIIEYPKYWAQLTESRKQKLHPKEVALLKALNSTLSVDFKGTAFNEVLDYLQEKTGQAIIVNDNALKDAMIETNDPVTFKVNKVTVRTILRKVLADRGLTYIIKEGMIQVVTQQQARETMVVRAYPVADLVGADPLMGQMAPFAVAQNVQNLISMIVTAVEPGHWQINGGPGTITFYPPTMSLVVRASAEMHYMFGGTGLLGR